MGPIETGLRQRAHEIHERFYPRPKQTIDYERQIQTLRDIIRILKDELYAVRHELEKYKPPSVDTDIIHKIVEIVSRETKVPVDKITTPCRKQDAVYARHICFYLICEHTGFSMSALGRKWGFADHTAVLSGRRNVANRRKIDQIFHEKLLKLEQGIYGPSV